MSTTTGVGGVTSTSMQGALTGATSTMGKDDFLKLLMAQISKQDPLNPMDNTQFVSQLAQFSSLEQLVGVNDNLGLLQLGQASLTNGQMASFIGREIEANGDTLQQTQPGPATISFDLGGTATESTVTIRNSSGEVVRTIAGGPRATGTSSLVWDGRDNMGNLLPAGSYTVGVAAKDAAGAAVTASTQVRGVVTGVTYKGGIPMLEIGSTTVRIGDVIAVRTPPSSTSGTTTNGNGSNNP